MVFKMNTATTIIAFLILRTDFKNTTNPKTLRIQMKTKDERCRLYPSITSTIALTLDTMTYSLISWPISQTLENLDVVVVLLLACAGLTDHVLRVLHLLSAFSCSFSA